MMGFELIFILGIGALAYALGWRPQVNHTGPAPSGESPAEILKARYARGEITRGQFEEMKHTLGVSDASSANEPAHH